MGRPRQVHRQGQGIRGAVWNGGVDLVLLRADGRQGLRRRPSVLQERLAAVLPEVVGARAGLGPPELTAMATERHRARVRAVCGRRRPEKRRAAGLGPVAARAPAAAAQPGGARVRGVFLVWSRCAWPRRYGRTTSPTRLRTKNNLTGQVKVDGKKKDVVTPDGVPIGPTWQGAVLPRRGRQRARHRRAAALRRAQLAVDRGVRRADHDLPRDDRRDPLRVLPRLHGRSALARPWT